METTAFVIFLSIAVLGVGAVLFIGWLAVVLVRGGGRLLGLATGLNFGSAGRAAAAVVCPRKQCRAINPAEARFCRRCGIGLGRRPARTRANGAPSAAGPVALRKSAG